MTVPDYRDNRALIAMSALSRPLLEYLAEHYPPDALAVQADPTFGGAGSWRVNPGGADLKTGTPTEARR